MVVTVVGASKIRDRCATYLDMKENEVTDFCIFSGSWSSCVGKTKTRPYRRIWSRVARHSHWADCATAGSINARDSQFRILITATFDPFTLLIA